MAGPTWPLISMRGWGLPPHLESQTQWLFILRACWLWGSLITLFLLRVQIGPERQLHLKESVCQETGSIPAVAAFHSQLRKKPFGAFSQTIFLKNQPTKATDLSRIRFRTWVILPIHFLSIWGPSNHWPNHNPITQILGSQNKSIFKN